MDSAARTVHTVFIPGIILLMLMAIANSAMAERSIEIGSENCQIRFDPTTGGLWSIRNPQLEDECLKDGNPGTMPFRIYADLKEEFVIGQNELFQLVFQKPEEICATVIQPDSCQLTEVIRKNGLTLIYEGGGFEIRLAIVLKDVAGVSDWTLQIKNTGSQPRDLLIDFPALNGVRLGPEPAENLATAMDQAGVTVPAWERPGGVLGESNQLSMQWHAIWDPHTKSALGLLFMDPDARPKRLVLAEPSIDLHYFPPIKLQPGESYTAPPVRFLVYAGDWKPAARAYRAWHDKAFGHLEPPEWYRHSNGSVGRHFKKAGPGVSPSNSIQVILDDFRELPATHIRCPIDFPEYAFYCRASMFGPVHIDGDNIIREDMGGAEALREGIEGVHRLGLHTQIYVEGFIVHKDSELARSGNAERWAVTHRDGTQIGPYSKQNFYHMCPGCVEWQDHLAGMVGRLLRETGADGVRLDSLGFYYLPCYNPAHNHKKPFGYNEWIKQLLAKVHDAAVAANPNMLLSTEGSADWFTPWVHGALTSRCSRDLPFMRLAVGPYRPYVYATGSVWASLSGFPGGGCESIDIKPLDANWLCARFPVHQALVWGDVLDSDPQSSDPEIVTRQFAGDGYWAVVAVRPASQERIWPRGTGLSEKHADYTLTFPGLAPLVEDAVICDIETLAWQPLKTERDGDDLHLRLKTNWGLIILRRQDSPKVAGFDPLPVLHGGESTTFTIQLLSSDSYKGNIHVTAPGLNIKPDKVSVSDQVTVNVPAGTFPGHYAVQLNGENLLGIKRFLVVE